MKILILDDDMGSAYRLTDGILEFAPLMKNGTFDTDDFGPVEPELVGEESVTFKGIDTNLYAVFKYATETLRGVNHG